MNHFFKIEKLSRISPNPTKVISIEMACLIATAIERLGWCRQHGGRDATMWPVVCWLQYGLRLPPHRGAPDASLCDAAVCPSPHRIAPRLCLPEMLSNGGGGWAGPGRAEGDDVRLITEALRGLRAVRTAVAV